MRDYYRRTLIDRWDDLLDLSPTAQRLYFYAFAGPTSTAYGLSLIHAGRTRRDLGITKLQLQAALVELSEAGCVLFDEVKASRYVLADVDLAKSIAPRDPNNKIAAAKRCHHVPLCDTQRNWMNALGIGAQLPESTGNRGASPSQALPKPSPSKKENKKENEKHSRSDPSDLHRAAWAAWLEHLGNDPRSKQHRSKDGLPASKDLRRVLVSFVNSDKGRDFGAYFAYLASVQPWDWFDGTFSVNIEWATRAATRTKVASEGYAQPRPDKPAQQQKPRHVQAHEGAWFDKQGGYWRTQTGYPIDQWGKPDYGAKVRFNPEQQEALKW